MNEVYKNLTDAQVKEIEDIMVAKRDTRGWDNNYYRDKLDDVLKDLDELEKIAKSLGTIVDKYHDLTPTRRKGSELRVLNRSFISSIKDAIKEM